MTKKIQKLFLTINAGQRAEDSAPSQFQRYIGIAPVNVIALNPNKEELEKLYGYTVNKEPEYELEFDGQKARRLEFHVRTVKNNDRDIDTTGKIRFVISNEDVTNRERTKYQVIDKYGETTWVTTEQLQAGQRPDNCRVVGPYRVCKRGEAELTHFIKEWLNYTLSTAWDNDSHKYTAIAVENLPKCEIDLSSCWNDLINGDLTQLSELIPVYKDYAVKVCFGVRTTEDNRHYQEVFNREFLRNNSNSYSKFDKKINSLKEIGMYADTEFSTSLLREWHVQPTTFTNSVPEQPATVENTEMPETYGGSNDLPF